MTSKAMIQFLGSIDGERWRFFGVKRTETDMFSSSLFEWRIGGSNLDNVSCFVYLIAVVGKSLIFQILDLNLLPTEYTPPNIAYGTTHNLSS